MYNRAFIGLNCKKGRPVSATISTSTPGKWGN